MDLFIFLTSDGFVLFCFLIMKAGEQTLLLLCPALLSPLFPPHNGAVFLSCLQDFKSRNPSTPPLSCMQSSYRDKLCGYASGLRGFGKAERNMILKTDFLTWGFDLIFRTESRNLNLEWLWGSSSC